MLEQPPRLGEIRQWLSGMGWHSGVSAAAVMSVLQRGTDAALWVHQLVRVGVKVSPHLLGSYYEEGSTLGSEGNLTFQNFIALITTQLRNLDLRHVVPEGEFWNLTEGQSGTPFRGRVTL